MNQDDTFGGFRFEPEMTTYPPQEAPLSNPWTNASFYTTSPMWSFYPVNDILYRANIYTGEVWKAVGHFWVKIQEEKQG